MLHESGPRSYDKGDNPAGTCSLFVFCNALLNVSDLHPCYCNGTWPRWSAKNPGCFNQFSQMTCIIRH